MEGVSPILTQRASLWCWWGPLYLAQNTGCTWTQEYEGTLDWGSWRWRI